MTQEAGNTPVHQLVLLVGRQPSMLNMLQLKGDPYNTDTRSYMHDIYTLAKQQW